MIRSLFLMVLPVMAFGQVARSRLELFDLRSNQRQVLHVDTVRFEAPNWTKDGRHLIINQQGKLYKVSLSDGHKVIINTDFATACNNDHGVSPDGQTIVISHYTDKTGNDYRTSTIYTLPISGGTPKQVTANAPSFWHGWSPNGRTLAFVGERKQPDGSQNFDIYTISAKGGQEKRLTHERGLDDGPDYSPDGRYIYFNSVRTGRMQLWRMDADGENPIQLTDDSYNNWFPHPSPDGHYILFLTYLEPIDPNTHPADKQVALRLMDVQTGSIRELVRLQGGQGTINVPCWSPDSQRFAFVSYN